MPRRDLSPKNATPVDRELVTHPEINLSSVFWEHRPSVRLSASVRFENLNGSISQGEKYSKNSSIIKLKNESQNEICRSDRRTLVREDAKKVRNHNHFYEFRGNSGGSFRNHKTIRPGLKSVPKNQSRRNSDILMEAISVDPIKTELDIYIASVGMRDSYNTRNHRGLRTTNTVHNKSRDFGQT
jgi:hypothetical protein